VSWSDAEGRGADDTSSRCLLDCLCKDEMKCCKSVTVAKMNTGTATDCSQHSRTALLHRRQHINKQLCTVNDSHPRHCLTAQQLNTLNRDKMHQQQQQQRDTRDEDVPCSCSISRTYCSLPNIVGVSPTYSQSQPCTSPADTSEHSLRTKPSDSVYVVQVM